MFKPILASIALAALPVTAFAGEDAEAVIEEAAAELNRGEFSNDDLIETFDIRRIARFTLGKYARRAEAKDLSRFEQAFERFLIDRFEQEEHRFVGANIEIKGSVDRSERDSVVETRVTLPDQDPIDVRWRVIKADSDWRVVDVEVAGLWLAIEQRAQIDAVFGRSGADMDDAINALKSSAPREYAAKRGETRRN